MVNDRLKSYFICGSCSSFIESLTNFVQQCRNSCTTFEANKESSVGCTKIAKLEVEVFDTDMEFIDEEASNITGHNFYEFDDSFDEYDDTMEVDNKECLEESNPAEVAPTDDNIGNNPEVDLDFLIAIDSDVAPVQPAGAGTTSNDGSTEIKPEAATSKKISYRKFTSTRRERWRANKKQCHVCGKRVIDLISHVESHGGTGHQCQFCDRICPNRRQLRVHMNRHTKERAFPCRYCDKIFFVWSSRKNHETNAHKKETFQCDACDAVYKHKSYLQAHKKFVHLGIRNLKCTKCDFSTSIKSRLLNHIRSIHTSERPYKCTVCGHLSNSNTGYYIHFQRHKKSGEATSYAIKCAYCEKLFDKDTPLETHIVKAHHDRAVVI